MTANIFLRKVTSESWQWSAGSSLYYLDISGVRVAEIDSSGNLRIKGRVLKIP